MLYHSGTRPLKFENILMKTAAKELRQKEFLLEKQIIV